MASNSQFFCQQVWKWEKKNHFDPIGILIQANVNYYFKFSSGKKTNWPAFRSRKQKIETFLACTQRTSLHKITLLNCFQLLFFFYLSFFTVNFYWNDLKWIKICNVWKFVVVEISRTFIKKYLSLKTFLFGKIQNCVFSPVPVLMHYIKCKLKLLNFLWRI